MGQRGGREDEESAEGRRETLPAYCHSGLPLSANNFVITGVHCITEVVRILPWSLG